MDAGYYPIYTCILYNSLELESTSTQKTPTPSCIEVGRYGPIKEKCCLSRKTSRLQSAISMITSDAKLYEEHDATRKIKGWQVMGIFVPRWSQKDGKG